MCRALRHRGAGWFLGAICLAAWTEGCAEMPPTSALPAVLRTAVHVQHHWLALRLSPPRPATLAHPVLLFVTGDGGWHGRDLDAFDHLIAWGYSVVGVSAPEYLKHLGEGAKQLPARQLAEDLAQVADTGRAQLGLSASAPVLMLGVSRGADLVVVAAAQRPQRSAVLGVLAVGLTREEAYVRRWGERSGLHDALLAQPYAVLRRIAVPVCVIQSTNDEYITAADARRLFGPDSDFRRLQAIEARNHSFSDARDALYEAMRQSLLWVASQDADQRQVHP